MLKNQQLNVVARDGIGLRLAPNPKQLNGFTIPQNARKCHIGIILAHFWHTFRFRSSNTPPLATTPTAAARVYDLHARKLFGEFARLNFPTKEVSA